MIVCVLETDWSQRQTVGDGPVRTRTSKERILFSKVPYWAEVIISQVTRRAASLVWCILRNQDSPFFMKAPHVMSLGALAQQCYQLVWFLIFKWTLSPLVTSFYCPYSKVYFYLIFFPQLNSKVGVLRHWLTYYRSLSCRCLCGMLRPGCVFPRVPIMHKPH